MSSPSSHSRGKAYLLYSVFSRNFDPNPGQNSSPGGIFCTRRNSLAKFFVALVIFSHCVKNSVRIDAHARRKIFGVAKFFDRCITKFSLRGTLSQPVQFSGENFSPCVPFFPSAKQNRPTGIEAPLEISKDRQIPRRELRKREPQNVRFSLRWTFLRWQIDFSRRVRVRQSIVRGTENSRCSRIFSKESVKIIPYENICVVFMHGG